jgi:hypothetical protein
MHKNILAAILVLLIAQPVAHAQLIKRKDVFKENSSYIYSESSGKNVGIGTQTPSEKLSVVGNINVSGNLKDNSGNSVSVANITNKIDKVSGAVNGNLPVLNSSGGLVDGGVAPGDLGGGGSGAGLNEDNFLMFFLKYFQQVSNQNVHILANAFIDMFPPTFVSVATAPNGVNDYTLGNQNLRPLSKMKGNRHFDGDASAPSFVWTSQMTGLNPNGSPTYSTGVFKFGTHSVTLNGTNQFFTWGSSSGMSSLLVGNDFTFEMWVYLNGAPGTFTILSSGANTTNKAFEWKLTSTAMVFNYSNDGTNATTLTSDAITWNTGQWYHVEVNRSGNNFYMFRDGALISTGLTLTGNIFTPLGNNGGIGRDWGSTNFFNGNIDEFSIWIGYALHTSNFTPPSAAYSDSQVQNLPNVISRTYNTPTSPGTVTLLAVMADLTEAITINTDLKFAVSMDNGVNFNEVTMSKVNPYQIGTSNTYRGSISTSGMTSTNQLVWRVQGFNNKRYSISNLIVVWQ